MVKQWTFPSGPAVATPPAEEPLVLFANLEEDIKPFAAWFVPISPNPETANDTFPVLPLAHVPPPISTAATYSGVGYNDPPISAFANPSTPNRNPISPTAYRSFSAPLARASPPVSRSATYNNHVTVLSSSSFTSSVGPPASTSSSQISSSRFSFTNLASSLGSYVKPSSGGPAAAICSVAPPVQDEYDDGASAMGQESGQWVLRAHQASESMSPRVWSTPEFNNSVELPSPTSAASGRGGGAKGRFVDPKRQPVPWGSPLNHLDFREVGCKCSGGVVIEL